MVSHDFIPPGDPGFGDPGIPAGFSAIFTLIVVIILVGVGFSVFIGIRKYLLIKRAGHDPFTVDAALAARVLNSDMLRPGTATDDAAPAKTLEQRLADVDALHERGVISDAERTAARAAILAG
ncbi:SHOCT domain-containing protein [Microbacterium sp. SSM24]|uniref:SHOCT domain-containing protein n=1 Tax=Microbacterium sp. SSM24 TaxID=2991714 RepID=UPI002226C2AB|nr:SHOCT domain-containing protein [Microbacterium sp. SSM24]MCW3491729.1 SHOCT domain-containing protein [Microbacterium sp. SSM24]